MRFFRVLFAVVAFLAGSAGHAQEPDREDAPARGGGKLSDDPTKVVTKLSIGYSEFATLRGSLAFGPVTKINASVSEDDQWSIGGSYLFNFGIVNFAASRKNLSSGITQTQYSVGSFAPLDAFGISLERWQVFPTIGFNYTEGEATTYDFDLGDTLYVEASSKGGYIGVLGLRPLSEKWTFKGGAILSAGSGDYSGVGAGAGFTFNFNPKNSVSFAGVYIDNSFGTRDLLSVRYTREF